MRGSLAVVGLCFVLVVIVTSGQGVSSERVSLNPLSWFPSLDPANRLARSAAFDPEKEATRPRDNNGGGVPCNLCVMIARVIIVKVENESSTVDQALTDICSYLPPPTNTICNEYVKKYGETLVTAFFDYESPDRICAALGICTNPEQCVMYPSVVPVKDWPERGQPPLIDWEAEARTLPPWLEWIGNYFGNEHKPIDDVDRDFFSPSWKAFRGRDWRGRDCNDLDPSVHPGALPINSDKQWDSNCNLIFGVDPSTGRPWEEELCNVTQMGVAILGDSVGAHFAFPCTWYFPAPGVYDHGLYYIENEGDWPFTSWITGFRNDTTGLLDPGRPKPLDSVYLRMLERNRCMWNDFQNLAVNGADSQLSVNNLHAFSRNQKTDRPVLFFQTLIGDDICDHRSESGWTEPPQFAAAITQNLEYLNTKLPPGSFVVNIGLIDGRVIFDTLHDEPYPFSPQSLGGNATYETWWNFQTCLGTVVCWGWMVDNATIRDQASARARELNAVFKNITYTQTYSNFEMTYYDFPIAKMFATLEAQGGTPIDFFEPFLGLHPTQHAVAILGQILYDEIDHDFGDRALGPVNPNNARIIELFGASQQADLE